MHWRRPNRQQDGADGFYRLRLVRPVQKFDKETLSTDQFRNTPKRTWNWWLWISRRKPQSDALKAANNALAEKYGVDGFPTFVALNADGKEIGRQAGYAAAGRQPSSRNWKDTARSKFFADASKRGANCRAFFLHQMDRFALGLCPI